VRWARHEKPPEQRVAASPSSRTVCAPQTGQASGMTKGRASAGRRSATTPTTSGMTSPARRTITVSPMHSPPLRATSSALCKVALVTVTPPTNTGFSRATGVSAPVRPTWMSIASTTVNASCGGYLCATAQRGSRERKPRRRCRSSELTLYTTPSMSKGRLSRSAAMRWWKPASASPPSTTARCSQTGRPKAASASSMPAWVLG
jgi:hypothetical protein